MLEALKAWAGALKRDLVALWLAARDPRTPLSAKVLAACVAAYGLSPVDLIPDFIPVLGYLDDLLLVPWGIWLAVRLIPASLMAELRARAVLRMRPVSRTAAAIVVGVWIAGAVTLWVVVWRSEWAHRIVEAVGR